MVTPSGRSMLSLIPPSLVGVAPRAAGARRTYYLSGRAVNDAPRLGGEIAVVHEQGMTGDARRRVAREEDGGADELARQDQLLAQHPRLDEVARHRRLLRPRARQRRVAEPRRDRRHPDAAVDPLER